jgi:hypothetical protein
VRRNDHLLSKATIIIEMNAIVIFGRKITRYRFYEILEMMQKSSGNRQKIRSKIFERPAYSFYILFLQA